MSASRFAGSASIVKKTLQVTPHGRSVHALCYMGISLRAADHSIRKIIAQSHASTQRLEREVCAQYTERVTSLPFPPCAPDSADPPSNDLYAAR